MSTEPNEPPKLDPPSNCYGEASSIFGEIQVILAEKQTELLNANTVACSAS